MSNSSPAAVKRSPPPPRTSPLLIVAVFVVLGALGAIVFAIIRQIAKNREAEKEKSGTKPEPVTNPPAGGTTTEPNPNDKPSPPTPPPEPEPVSMTWEWVPIFNQSATLRSNYGTSVPTIFNIKYDVDWVDEPSGVLLLTIHMPSVSFGENVLGILKFPIGGVRPQISLSLKKSTVNVSVAKSTTASWYRTVSPSIKYRFDTPSNKHAMDLILDLRLSHPNGITVTPSGDLSFIMENVK